MSHGGGEKLCFSPPLFCQSLLFSAASTALSKTFPSMAYTAASAKAGKLPSSAQF